MVTPTVRTGSLKRNTLTDQIVEWLSERIIAGEYRPGVQLYETELAETLGCSRSPLREAMRTLAQEGLVEIRPGHGTYVTPLDAKAAAEFYDTRALLETETSRLAAESMTDKERQSLKDALAELAAAAHAQDIDRYQSLNWQFHSLLYSYCPNETLIDLVRLMWRRSLRYGYILRRDTSRLLPSLKRKQRLLTALETGTPEQAAEIQRSIVLNGKEDVLRALREGGSDPYSYFDRLESASV